MTSSEVKWRETGSDGGVATKADDIEATSGRITDNTYTIGGLKSDTEYTITVTVVNPAGSMANQLITFTIENGNKYTEHIQYNSFFPTSAGIFYYAFHFFRHIYILQEYLNCCRNTPFSEFSTCAGSMFPAHLKNVGHFSI